MTTRTAQGNYADINGLKMYYEVHGTGGTPLLLLHGAYSAIGTSFAKVLPGLAEKRQVVGVELQGHGRTADIDRPLTMPQMADDVAALIQHLGFENADVFGYSMGAGVALYTALRHPNLVRKLVAASVSYNNEAFYPGFMDSMTSFKPEYLYGTPWHDEYKQLSPHPEKFDALVEKMIEFDLNLPELAADDIRGMKTPTLLIIGDSDIVRPEHAAEMFRLLGGGVIGEMAGMPNSQLAVLPGTPHSTLMERDDLLVPIVNGFLAAPISDTNAQA
jgi:pimeloyl-ACP methyl ester carboxylesterase